MSLLSEQLSSFDYYKNKLPLFLQNSYGFLEQFRIWHDFLVGIKDDDSGVLSTSDRILSLMNVFDSQYIEKLNDLEDSNFGKASDFLDRLAKLFGLNRSFTVSYIKDLTPHVDERLELSNEDLLILIRATIIKSWFKGTYEQLLEQYLSIGLVIFQTTSPILQGVSDVYLLSIEEQEYSENVEAMFLSGLLTVQSVGIVYNYSLQKAFYWLIWRDDSYSDLSLMGQVMKDENVYTIINNKVVINNIEYEIDKDLTELSDGANTIQITNKESFLLNGETYTIQILYRWDGGQWT